VVLVDVEQAVLKNSFDIITTNAAIITLFGRIPDVFIAYPDEKEQPYPFFVQRFDWSNNQDPVIRAGYWSLAIWDKADLATRVWALKHEIGVLFDSQIFIVPDVVKARYYADTPSGFVPDPEPGIWHYEMRFAVRVTRYAEIIRQV
jgi:hypothetical protein